jgi:hypothetical protein
MTDPCGTEPGDPVTAALMQLSQHEERLSELATLVTGLGRTLRDQAAILDGLDGMHEQVAALAARLAEIHPVCDSDSQCYTPRPAPRWWRLDGDARERAADKLRAWVEEIYRPGYGRVAAALGPCWNQHPLCLYALDIVSELWAVLYLRGERTSAILSAQAEFQTRILPAIAEQLMAETNRCGHAQASRSVTGAARTWTWPPEAQPS